MSSHNFGGSWTQEKLDRLRKYLVAYTTIFKSNQGASYLQTTFVDAFAGTGAYNSTKEDDSGLRLPQGNENDADVKDFQKGSAQIAIETEPPFDHYLFIEKKPAHVQELERLRSKFPDKKARITINPGDANTVLKKWCRETNWQKERAVVFLDPYGMAVEWSTMEMIASTKSIDLWLLFPLGQAVNRLLTKNSPPPKAWADRLTLFFGTEDWKNAFYRPRPQMSFFETDETLEKGTDFDGISKFFIERLSTIFTKVADNPLPLYNSTNVPIYLLCFAASNPKGAPTAVKIAQHILRPD